MFSYLHGSHACQNFLDGAQSGSQGWFRRGRCCTTFITECLSDGWIDGQELWHWLFLFDRIVRDIVPRAEFFQPPRLRRSQGEVQVRGDAAREVNAAGQADGLTRKRKLSGYEKDTRCNMKTMDGESVATSVVCNRR